MERSNLFSGIRGLTAIIIGLAILAFSFLAGPLWYFVFFLLVFVFLIAGIRKIPAEPHTRGVVTFLGRKTTATIGDGFVFLPLQPILFDLILVEMTNKLIEIEPKNIRAPGDATDVYLKITILWNPDPEYLAEFLDRGGEETVRKTIEDVSEAAVRKLISDPENGPKRWREILQNSELLVEAVIEALFEARDKKQIKEAAGDISRGFNKYRIPYLGVLINRIDVILSPPPREKISEPSPIIV